MTVGEKIKTLRRAKGFTQTELGNRVGVQKNAVSKWECGRVEDIPTSMIKSLATLFNVPPSYLIDDDSDPYEAVPSSHEFQSMPRMKQWKVLGGVACGDPAYLPLEETVEAPADIRADFVFKCCGDSMINARIYDGDLVFIRRGDVPDGAIGVVRVDDEYSLKRIYHHDDFLELCPENPKYRPIILHGDQMNGEVIGRAVFFLSAVI